MIVERAFAKINLFLDVCAKRDDGYHDIESVMQSVSLYDEIYLDAKSADVTEINVVTEMTALPSDKDNLVYRAAQAYLDASGLRAKVDIVLKKKIPISAGLAGGSSDAAATLRAMNRCFSSLSDEKMMSVAASIGSDVPFCLIGGTAVCRGRGEFVENIFTPESYAVIAIGDDRISTPEAYARLDRIYNGFDGSVPTPSKEYFEDLLSCINAEKLSMKLYNIFETEIDKIAESVIKIKAELKKCGASATLMSGSGPSVFGLFSNQKTAEAAESHLRSVGYDAYAVKFCK